MNKIDILIEACKEGMAIKRYLYDGYSRAITYSNNQFFSEMYIWNEETLSDELYTVDYATEDMARNFLTFNY